MNEFIENAKFRDWVYEPGRESDAYWEKYLLQHPERETDIKEAKIFLTGVKLHVEDGFSLESGKDVVYNRIRKELSESRPVKPRQVFWVYWAAAACLCIAMGWWYYGASKQIGSASYEQNISLIQDPLSEKANRTNSTMLVKLADGSSVILKPGSKISYPTQFLSRKYREVFLSGEAFFEVAKDPGKPFLVYANELVTRVVGTSFDVKALDTDQNVTVKVHSGKVAVSVGRQARKETNVTAREVDGILLLPNQQAVLSRAEIRLVKALVENPVVLEKEVIAPEKYTFRFDGTLAPVVFQTLEKAYGVDIQYDKTLFNTCQFSADLTDESLYEKLDVICRSLEATYQILDAQIIINGKGCN